VTTVLVINSMGLGFRGSFGGSSGIRYGKIGVNGIIGTLYTLIHKCDWEGE